MMLFSIPVIEKIIGLKIYEQYGDDEAMRGFFRVLKEMLYQNLKDKVEGLEQISYKYDGDNDYLQFYYENLFAMFRSFGESRIKNLYDTGKKFDTALIYDDANFKGLLDLRDYKTLLKWTMDYSQEGFTLGWLAGFVGEFCKTSGDFSFDFGFDKLTILIKNTRESVLLQQIFRNEGIYDNLPLDIIFRFI